MPLATFGDSISSFADAAGSFFQSLADVGWGSLLLGLACYGIYLLTRSRASFHVIRAAYPGERIEWRRIWGAYVVAYGFSSVVPAHGGNVIRLFLVKSSVPNSTYPAVASSFLTEQIFDWSIAPFILGFAFSQGVFPKPPDFSKLQAFDLSFFASHPRLLLFVLTASAIAVLVAFAVLSARVRQGLAILRDRRRFVREVWLVQFGAWLFRCASVWFLLEAFHIGGSVRNVLLVLGVAAVSSLVPFTPGGAGVQQALLVAVFADQASGATVAAYSVGQQIALAAFSVAQGFVALVAIFRFRSFKAVLRAGREHRAAEAAG